MHTLPVMNLVKKFITAESNVLGLQKKDALRGQKKNQQNLDLSFVRLSHKSKIKLCSNFCSGSSRVNPRNSKVVINSVL